MGKAVAPRPVTDASTPAGAVRASNWFGFDLYLHEARNRPGENLICSPLSAAAALTMTSAGARGETQAQMARVLRIDQTKSPEAHASFASLVSNLNRRDGQDGMSLRVTNRLFGQAGMSFVADFLGLLRDRYQAPLESVDFVGATAAAITSINKWVAGQTHDRIKDLVSEGDVDFETRLVLVNAVYFKGQWRDRFLVGQTRDQAFVGPMGSVTTRMMHGEHTVAYAHVGTVQLIEMPYKGGLSMVVALPDKGHDLREIEGRLVDDYGSWMAALVGKAESVDIELPLWNAQTKLPLNQALSDLGMPLALGSRADFGGMAEHERLHIRTVVQESFIEVNEAGTEAAAATAVVNTREVYEFRTPFHADHPFLYFIRDPATGVVLFLGRIVNPTT